MYCPFVPFGVVNIVTMQAPKSTINEKACKDKFLIQSTVVPVGTTEKDITSNMVSSFHFYFRLWPSILARFMTIMTSLSLFNWQFDKDDGKYIEETKLKVVLISPPQSPLLSPINGVLKQEPTHGASVLRDPALREVENTTPTHMVRFFL